MHAPVAPDELAAAVQKEIAARARWVKVIGDIVTYHADPREDPSELARPAAVVIRGTRVR
jgi:hypothetical protein